MAEPTFDWRDRKLVWVENPEEQGAVFTLAEDENDPRLPDSVWFAREAAPLGEPRRVWLYGEAWDHFGKPETIRVVIPAGVQDG